jgi:hypothetical protein
MDLGSAVELFGGLQFAGPDRQRRSGVRIRRSR